MQPELVAGEGCKATGVSPPSPTKAPWELSIFGLTLLSAGIGAAAGLLVKAFKEALECLNKLLWLTLPKFFFSLGWTPDAPFALCNYTWLMGAIMGALVAALCKKLGPLPVPNLGAWVKEVHGNAGCPTAGYWLLSLAFLGLLTGLSGASVGPEPVVIIIPSVLAGAFARERLKQALSLAGGAGGLSAFFGLPLASAFMVLEVLHIDGAEFALEALPGCVMASLTGTILGDSIWHPAQLLGNSRYWFPGGSTEGAVAHNSFGLGALLFAPLAGFSGGLATHLLVAIMKMLHGPFHRLRRGRTAAVLLLATVGAANGLLAMLYPGAQWWGEEQLQVALTRGCAAVHNGTDCEPFVLPHYYAGLASEISVQASPGEPIPAMAMAGMAATKMVMIAICEAGGFVGGAIYPAVFMAGSLGSALGASPPIQGLGGQYVYLSTAAAMSVSLAALLNTNVFGVLLVVVLQANIPHGTISSQVIVLLTAVLAYYAFSRKLITPSLHFIVTQKARGDIQYLCQDISSGPEEETATDQCASDSEVTYSLSDSEQSATGR